MISANSSTIVDVGVGNHPPQISTMLTDVDGRNTKVDRLQHQQLEQSQQYSNNNEIYDINSSHHSQNTTTTANSSNTGETQTIRINDVLCGRGKVDHAGNAYFRQVVAEQLNDFKLYQSQKNRHGMSMVVQRIVQKVHDTGGRFMDQNWRGMWVELSEKERRQKVDRACRDAKKNSASSTNRMTPTSTAARTPTSSSSSPKSVTGRSADQSTTGIQYRTIHGTISSSNTQQQQQVLNHPIAEVIRSESSTTAATAAVAASTTAIAVGTNDTTIHINQNSSDIDAILPPSTMARLYPLTSGIHNSSHNSSKNKRNSTGQLIQVPATKSANAVIDANHHPSSAAHQAWATASPRTLSSSLTAEVPSSSLAQSPTTAALQVPSDNFNDVDLQQEKQQRMASDFHQIGNPTYNNQPNVNSSGNNSNMESSMSSFDRITDTTARTLSSSYITTPSLEFSCGSLAFENSFVIPDSNQNNVNNHGNEPALPSLIRQSQQPSQYRTSMDALQKRTTATGNNNNQHNINNASSNWTMASISSIPHDFLNKSVISEMDFSAVSLDLFSPVEEEGTERSTDTEENEAAVCTTSTTSTSTTATSTNTNPLAVLRGGSSSTPHQPMNESMNNASAIMMDASVSVLDLNQSYQPGSFFDASYNDNSSLLESSVTATSFTNSSERKEAFRRSVGSNSTAPQQERFLDRYDLLKREESVDTIIAGNLKRHSHISKSGGQKSTDSNDDELAESFNMSLDICALPSTNEEDDEEETPKQERVVKNVFVTQQPLQLQSPYQRSPEKKKIKDAAQLSLTSQLATNNSLWLSSDEFTSNRGNDSASVTSSLFSA